MTNERKLLSSEDLGLSGNEADQEQSGRLIDNLIEHGIQVLSMI